MRTRTQASPSSGYSFGTFQGVFVPTILTILGVVMYLRSGWVLGNLGLPATLIMVTAATLITFLTTLSLSSLATNTKVGGGGAYFMISRSFGVEVGAAIGVPLFFAQAISVSFYVTGFAESLASLLPQFNVKAIALTALVVMTLIAYFSADLALKSQYFILAAIGLSLLSLVLGRPPPEAVLPEGTPIPARLSFWPVFAVYFPAVTGILAGVSLSGDLRDPSRSIPRGTLAAVGVSYAVYMAIPVFLNYVVPDRNALLVNTMILRDVARWGSLILLGVWTASLSSAAGSILGAPRTLQALARDGVLPRWIGRGYGPRKDPRAATILTFFIALSGVLLGDINLIGPILTMFFLTTYGMLNLTAGMEELVGTPSWRPSFRVPYQIALAGGAMCAAAMFMIDPGATFVSGFVVFAVYYFMRRRSMRVSWGDMRYGVLMLSVRQSIRRLQAKRASARSWVPNILTLCGAPAARWHLIELSDALVGRNGFLTVASIVPTSVNREQRIAGMEHSIRAYLDERHIPAIVKVLAAADYVTGGEALVRAYGFGPLVPNTVMLGMTERPEKYVSFTQLIRCVHGMRRNVILVREGKPFSQTGRRLDVWWRGQSGNVDLMMVLAFLLSRDPDWRDADIRFQSIVRTGEDASTSRSQMEAFIRNQWISVDVNVSVMGTQDPFDVIRRESADADLVLLGLRAPAEGETDESYSQYYEQLVSRTRDFPVTAFVLAAEPIDFGQVFKQSR